MQPEIYEVRYQSAGKQVYVFRYNVRNQFAFVTRPNGTTSQTERGEVADVHQFKSYVTSPANLGALLQRGMLNSFEYLFDKNVGQGYTEFTIDEAYLLSSTMSDEEKTEYRQMAFELDETYCQLAKLRFDLNQFERIVVGRYRPDADMQLRNFQGTIDSLRQ
jgi:hypothetical protein